MGDDLLDENVAPEQIVARLFDGPISVQNGLRAHCRS
jgi:hypothetical protein